MLHRDASIIDDMTTQGRFASSLTVGLLVACSMTFASLPSLAAEPSTVAAGSTVGAMALEPLPSPSATAAAVAPAQGSISNGPGEGAGTAPSTATAASPTPEPSTQFIPYSMAAQAAARVEPVAPAVAVVTPKGADSLSAYVAGRWLIGQDQALRLVNMAHRVAAEHALDPLLLLAVAARESGFQYTGNAGSLDAEPNSKKVDPGTAHGLMQVAGRFHPDKMPVDSRGRMRVTTDEENLDIGARLLRENLSLDQGDVGRALQRYNGNLRDAGQRFARYVLKVRRDLQHVIRAE